MHFFVKIWTPKPIWYEMSLEERHNYIKKAQQGMIVVSELGLETIAWFEMESNNPDFQGKHRYCSIYKMKEEDMVAAFDKAMKEFQWYDYFEQTNVTGEMESPGALLEKVLKLSE